MWPDRQTYWRRKLRRLRFEAEPIEEQVARQFRATVGLTGVSAVIGSMFVAIFGAFGRVDVGLAVTGVLLVPVVLIAWLDFAILKTRASAYLAESRSHEGSPLS